MYRNEAHINIEPELRDLLFSIGNLFVFPIRFGTNIIITNIFVLSCDNKLNSLYELFVAKRREKCLDLFGLS